MAKDLAYYMNLNYPYELSEEEGEEGYFATHSDLPGCMSEGATAAEAIENLDASRELWIETRLDGGYSVPEPIGEEYSGRVSLRMTPSLHSRLVRLSRRENMSLNSLLNYALTSFAGACETSLEFSEDIRFIKDALRTLTLVGTGSSQEPPEAQTSSTLTNGGFQPQDSLTVST